MLLLSFGTYVVLVLLVVGVMLTLPRFLGERHAGRSKGEPYESGMIPTGSIRVRYSAHYYRIAIFFVIFDLEAVFLLIWASAARELGWFGYFTACSFTATLALGLLYLWRSGALDWQTSKRIPKGSVLP